MSSVTVGSFSNTKAAQVISDPAYWIGSTDDNIERMAQAIGAIYDENNYIYYINCNATGLPDIVFNIGGNSYTISSMEYVIDVSQIFNRKK